MDLAALEYPRHLHRPGGAFLVVGDAEACAAGLADGWTVECPPPDALEMAAAGSDGSAPVPSSTVTTAPVPSSPVRRGRPKKDG